jgi:hypothetical protein
MIKTMHHLIKFLLTFLWKRRTATRRMCGGILYAFCKAAGEGTNQSGLLLFLTVLFGPNSLVGCVIRN